MPQSFSLDVDGALFLQSRPCLSWNCFEVNVISFVPTVLATLLGNYNVCYLFLLLLLWYRPCFYAFFHLWRHMGGMLCYRFILYSIYPSPFFICCVAPMQAVLQRVLVYKILFDFCSFTIQGFVWADCASLPLSDWLSTYNLLMAFEWMFNESKILCSLVLSRTMYNLDRQLTCTLCIVHCQAMWWEPLPSWNYLFALDQHCCG